MPLREEAIDLHLQRYGANEPEIYETIFRIEMVLFSHKQEQEKEQGEGKGHAGVDCYHRQR